MRRYKSIVLSGLPLAGKSVLARALSEKYGMGVYSVGDIWKRKWKERHPDDKMAFEAFWQGTSEEENAAEDKKARETFERGGVVGDARYCAIFGGDVGLRVFITAEIDIRLERAFSVERYKGMDPQEMRDTLRIREADESVLGLRLYSKDFREPGHYHIVLNSGMLSLEEEVAAIDSLFEAD